MTTGTHSCEKCANGFSNVICVSKYRTSVYKSLGLVPVKCRLPADCGVSCGMPAAFVLVKGHPELSMDGFCGEKHRGYVVSGAWRSAQLRTLNAELDKLVAREESLRLQIRGLNEAIKTSTAPVYAPIKLQKLKVEAFNVDEKIQTRSTDLCDVMTSVMAKLSTDSSPKKTRVE
uniref:19kDa cysteine-rich protein n=1 Tax=Chinese wheat mosaic virus TaxID=83544 RepID=Q91QY5_9VIRU|nr:19kDa cysteine-rich protein [Chinese wheat mosaic virus]